MTEEESGREDNEDIIEISADDLDAEILEESPLPAAEDMLVIDHEDQAEVDQRPLTEAPVSYWPLSGVDSGRVGWTTGATVVAR